jgi:hypothetical protein
MQAAIRPWPHARAHVVKITGLGIRKQ